ncbi:MAG: hypothetical protein KIT02_16900 [Devosia sp.]|uniref:hypothetical protein n=1 Tax=Devosia sp. TaxID=1871048 RepID=UPI0024C9CECF|nr:hypothetical protein [Devosia sp.]UYN99559.1 MAG: hypothetical protein KIT02_16900 [Devosia sp.]
MNLPDVERLVSELLARGDMTSDTIEDLERIQAEARAGQSYPDDLDYLRALHARVTTGTSEVAPVSAEAQGGTIVENLQREIADLRAELDAAHRTVADLREQLAVSTEQ